MNKPKRLMMECENRNLNCSISYQKITNYSVEIYTGYKKNYKLKFYTDGAISPKKAIKLAFKWLDEN
jgi:hypothetical protein